MALFVPHKIVNLQSRNFTQNFKTKCGKLLGNHNNQYHNHRFVHHSWFELLSVKGLSLDGSFCECGSADSILFLAGRQRQNCGCEAPDPWNSTTKIGRELFCESRARDPEIGVARPGELNDQQLSKVDV